MFLRFHQINGKAMLLPLHCVRLIADHGESGAVIHTTIPAEDPTKMKRFRSQETVEELYRDSRQPDSRAYLPGFHSAA